MRFIIANEFYQQMTSLRDHTPDCYVRPGEYLHHMYIDGVKYTVAPAVLECLAQAEAAGDAEAVEHLSLHRLHYEALLADALRHGSLDGVTLLGDPPPTDDEASPSAGNPFTPRGPGGWEELGVGLPFLFDMVLRTIFNRGQITGSDMAKSLCVPVTVLTPVLQQMRKQTLIDIVGQKGTGGD